MVKAEVCKTSIRRFESDRFLQFALVVQWIECLTSDQMVVGSSPAKRTISYKYPLFNITKIYLFSKSNSKKIEKETIK